MFEKFFNFMQFSYIKYLKNEYKLGQLFREKFCNIRI